MSKPNAFQSNGNILLSVNPGIVLISLRKILLVPFSKKKSTLAKTSTFKALQASIANA